MIKLMNHFSTIMFTRERKKGKNYLKHTKKTNRKFLFLVSIRLIDNTIKSTRIQSMQYVPGLERSTGKSGAITMWKPGTGFMILICGSVTMVIILIFLQEATEAICSRSGEG